MVLVLVLLERSGLIVYYLAYILLTYLRFQKLDILLLLLINNHKFLNLLVDCVGCGVRLEVVAETLEIKFFAWVELFLGSNICLCRWKLTEKWKLWAMCRWLQWLQFWSWRHTHSRIAIFFIFWVRNTIVVLVIYLSTSFKFR